MRSARNCVRCGGAAPKDSGINCCCHTRCHTVTYCCLPVTRQRACIALQRLAGPVVAKAGGDAEGVASGSAQALGVRTAEKPDGDGQADPAIGTTSGSRGPRRSAVSHGWG